MMHAQYSCPLPCPSQPDGDIVAPIDPEPEADECSSCADPAPLVRYTNPVMTAKYAAQGAHIIVHRDFVGTLNTFANLASAHQVSLIVSRCAGSLLLLLQVQVSLIADALVCGRVATQLRASIAEHGDNCYRLSTLLRSCDRLQREDRSCHVQRRVS